jgi:hypothetical protein
VEKKVRKTSFDYQTYSKTRKSKEKSNFKGFLREHNNRLKQNKHWRFTHSINRNLNKKKQQKINIKINFIKITIKSVCLFKRSV